MQENVTVAAVTTQKLCAINLENQLLEIFPQEEDTQRVSNASQRAFSSSNSYSGMLHFSCEQKQACSFFTISLHQIF